MDNQIFCVKWWVVRRLWLSLRNPTEIIICNRTIQFKNKSSAKVQRYNQSHWIPDSPYAYFAKVICYFKLILLCIVCGSQE